VRLQAPGAKLCCPAAQSNCAGASSTGPLNKEASGPYPGDFDVAENRETGATNEPYKVESWGDNGRRLHKLLYAGNLQKARATFAQATKGGRFIRLTIRHGKRVLDEWRR
jgi:hypothetical protein